MAIRMLILQKKNKYKDKQLFRISDFMLNLDLKWVLNFIRLKPKDERTTPRILGVRLYLMYL